MRQSRIVSGTPRGINNCIAHTALKNEEGKVWAVEVFNIYAKRHECINLYELIEWNGKERVAEIVSLLIAEVK